MLGFSLGNAKIQAKLECKLIKWKNCKKNAVGGGKRLSKRQTKGNNRERTTMQNKYVIKWEEYG